MTVVRRYQFEAAHKLAWHPGKCQRLHGHSYVLEVHVTGELDERGVVMDFAEVDRDVEKSVLSILDHAYLNEVIENPTAELVTSWIGERLDESRLPWTCLRLWETQNGSVEIKR